MKEYLVKNKNDQYVLLNDVTCIPSGFVIEVPEGAQSHHIDKRNDVNFFLKCESRVFYFSYGKIWAVWVDFNKDSLSLFTTTWQREPIDKNEQVLKEILEGGGSAWDTQVGGDHYKKYKIQPMEFALKNNLNPLQHSVLKYVMRHEDKNGKQDLEKAKHYIDLMIEYYYGDS